MGCRRWIWREKAASFFFFFSSVHNLKPRQNSETSKKGPGTKCSLSARCFTLTNGTLAGYSVSPGQPTTYTTSAAPLHIYTLWQPLRSAIVSTTLTLSSHHTFFFFCLKICALGISAHVTPPPPPPSLRRLLT